MINKQYPFPPAEELLHSSPEGGYCRAILESLDVWILHRDGSGGVFYSNTAVEGILGYAADRFIADNTFFTHCMHVDDRELFVTVTAEAEASGIPATFPLRLIASDQKIVQTEVRIRSVLEEGVCQSLLYFIKNITAYRGPSEKNLFDKESLHFIVENSTDVIWIQEYETGRFEAFSPSAVAYFGALPEDLGAAYFDAVNNDPSYLLFRKQMEYQIERFLQGQEATRKRRYKYRQKTLHDGLQWFESEITISKNRDDAVRILGVTRNIDARQRLQSVLKESEEKFRAIFYNSLDGLFFVSWPEMRCAHANAALLRMTGYSEKELLQLSYMDLLGEVDTEEKSFFSGRFERVPFFCKGGGFFIADITFSVITLREQPGLLVSVRDMTDILEHENELVHTKSRFTHLFESSVQAILWADATGQVINANPAAERLFGYPKGALLGMHQSQLHPPALRKKNELLFMEASRRDGGRIEAQVLTASGEIREVAIYATVIEEDGAEIHQGIFNDITTERSLLRQVYKHSAAVIYSPISIIITGHDGIVEYANPTFCAYMEIVLDDIVGQDIVQIYREYVGDGEYEFALAAVSRGEVWKAEKQGVNQRREPIWFSLAVSPIFGDGRDISHFVVFLQDITEKRVNVERIKDLNSFKDQLISVLAHDLKNAFNGLLGFSELLTLELQDCSLPTICEYAAGIDQSLKDTYSLFEELLAWSKSLQGFVVYNPEEVALDEVIVEVVDFLRAGAEKKEVSILLERVESFAFPVDRYMFKTIIRNLLLNALKFTQTGGEIRITLVLHEGHAVIAIKDSGLGMDQETLEALFSIKEGLVRPDTSGKKGTGLGLLLSKDFVEKHGGRIEVESRVGEGALFTVTLPLSAIDG